VPLEKALNRAWEVTRGRAVVAKPPAGFGDGFHCGLSDSDCHAFVGVEIFFRNRLEAFWDLPCIPQCIPLSLADRHQFFRCRAADVCGAFERLPNRPMNLRHALPGALLTAILWEPPAAFHHLPSFLQLPPRLRLDWRYGISYDLGIYILSSNAFRSPGFAHPLRSP
jgi:hypothetical protein